eukprot:PhF_6_TR30110/c0_g1_i2/m.43950
MFRTGVFIIIILSLQTNVIQCDSYDDFELLTAFTKGMSQSCKHDTWNLTNVCLWQGVTCYETTVIKFIYRNPLCRDSIVNFTALPPNLIELDIGESALRSSSTDLMFPFLPMSLETLILQGNQFAGAVNWTALPSTLRVLTLDHNRNLSGAIPWTSLPPSLTKLSLQINKFEGSVDLTQLPQKLDLLYIQGNRFTGTLDTTALPPKISQLTLSDNQFSGTLNFDSMPRYLRDVYIENLKNVTGTVRLDAFSDTLLFLYLNNNSFSGTVDISTLPKNLQRLSLEDNFFTGVVNLSNVPKSIHEIYLANNKFERLDIATALPTTADVLRIKGNYNFCGPLRIDCAMESKFSISNSISCAGGVRLVGSCPSFSCPPCQTNISTNTTTSPNNNKTSSENTTNSSQSLTPRSSNTNPNRGVINGAIVATCVSSFMSSPSTSSSVLPGFIASVSAIDSCMDHTQGYQEGVVELSWILHPTGSWLQVVENQFSQDDNNNTTNYTSSHQQGGHSPKYYSMLVGNVIIAMVAFLFTAVVLCWFVCLSESMRVQVAASVLGIHSGMTSGTTIATVYILCYSPEVGWRVGAFLCFVVVYVVYLCVVCYYLRGGIARGELGFETTSEEQNKQHQWIDRFCQSSAKYTKGTKWQKSVKGIYGKYSVSVWYYGAVEIVLCIASAIPAGLSVGIGCEASAVFLAIVTVIGVLVQFLVSPHHTIFVGRLEGCVEIMKLTLVAQTLMNPYHEARVLGDIAGSVIIVISIILMVRRVASTTLLKKSRKSIMNNKNVHDDDEGGMSVPLREMSSSSPKQVDSPQEQQKKRSNHPDSLL